MRNWGCCPTPTTIRDATALLADLLDVTVHEATVRRYTYQAGEAALAEETAALQEVLAGPPPRPSRPALPAAEPGRDEGAAGGRRMDRRQAGRLRGGRARAAAPSRASSPAPPTRPRCARSWSWTAARKRPIPGAAPSSRSAPPHKPPTI